MKIAILGASGGIGRELVQQAQDAGHTVVGIGRATSNLDHVTGTVHRGAFDDVAFLSEAFDGCEVVVATFGLMLSGLSPFASCEDPTLMERAGPAIAQAASAAGVKRILAVSSGGVGSSREQMPAIVRAFFAVTALRKVYPQLEKYEAALQAGSVEAVLVRPTGLTDGPATGEVVVSPKLAGYATISRADVAAFMLSQIEGPLDTLTPLITVTGTA